MPVNYPPNCLHSKTASHSSGDGFTIVSCENCGHFIRAVRHDPCHLYLSRFAPITENYDDEVDISDPIEIHMLPSGEWVGECFNRRIQRQFSARSDEGEAHLIGRITSMISKVEKDMFQ